MRPRRLLVWAAAALVTAPTSAVGHPVRLHAYDAELKPTWKATWNVGGEIAGTSTVGAICALPGGEFVGPVEPPSGPTRLVRWNAAGNERGRIVPKLEGKILAMRVRKDGSYLVVTASEIAAVDARDGRVLARRPVPAGAAKADVQAGEIGAWFVFVDSDDDSPVRGRLVHAPLEGPEVTRALPMMSPPLERCRKEYGSGRCPWAAWLKEVVPLTDGGALVSEELEFFHNARGPNRTVQVVLMLLDRDMKLVAERTFGDLEPGLDWFWVEKSPSNPTFLPNAFGLVRRRYDGRTRFDAGAESADGDLLVVMEHHLSKLDRALRPRWTRWAYAEGTPAFSPPWTDPIFYFAGSGVVYLFDAQGKHAREGEVNKEDYNRRWRWNTVGRSASGEWLVVTYGAEIGSDGTLQ